MPRFAYIVKDKEGKTYKNVIDANNQLTVVDRLQKDGYFIVNIKELSIKSILKDKSATRKKKKFSHTKVRLQDILTFSRQLATMLEAGVTLIRSLDVIQAQVQSQQLFLIMEKVKKDVEQGGSLSLALSKHPKVFNQFWVSLVEVGEASGTIPVVLNKLAFYLEQQNAFRTHITSAIIYPSILFCVAIGAVGFFALFVGPRFEAIFKSLNADLPLITSVLLKSFSFIKTHILHIIGGIVAFIFLFKKYIQTYGGRLRWEKFIYGLPTIGDVYRIIVVERFSSQMAILIDSGVPILYALDISERLVDNHTCALIINNIKESVREGELLVQPMERSGFFPPMAIQMIHVGEETGELSKMLKHVSQFYQDEVETFMKRFGTIIEPFMLIFMGVVIGTIVVAMFLPMFNLSQLGGSIKKN